MRTLLLGVRKEWRYANIELKLLLFFPLSPSSAFIFVSKLQNMKSEPTTHGNFGRSPRRRRRVADLPTPKNRAGSSHKETGEPRMQDLASGLGRGYFQSKDSETLQEAENAA